MMWTMDDRPDLMLSVECDSNQRQAPRYNVRLNLTFSGMTGTHMVMETATMSDAASTDSDSTRPIPFPPAPYWRSLSNVPIPGMTSVSLRPVWSGPRQTAAAFPSGQYVLKTESDSNASSHRPMMGFAGVDEAASI